MWNRVAPLGESETYSCKPIVKPSVEVCDGVDNDCDGLVDEGIPTIRFYPDNDGDSFGDATSPGRDLCQQQRPSNPNPWVTNNKDCDDSNPATKPGGTEICDGVDNNCDGAKDDNIKKWYRDADGDGFGDKKQTKPTYEACQRTSDKKICTGPNNCIDPTGLADNNQDCCDASKDAKPGQTAYFATSIPNCGGFDYNCDGNEERHIPVCQCSKTLEFYISDNVNDSGILHRWYTSNQQAVSPAGFVPNFQGSQESVYSNPVNCEFSGQAKFENKAQLLYPYRCPTELLCGGGTPKGLTMPAKSFSVDWTQLPKYEESVVVKKPYWIFKKSEHKANCAFMTDGRLPPCGTTQAYRAPTVEQTRLNGSTVKKADVYTGTFKACHLCSHPIVKVSLDGFFRTSANYVFTKQATQLAPTLKCR
ncbi:MAG: hypothetical protein EP343_25000 [Deltaproteobacteria bacterium]|nr:MAG: hypothetical protein EP343_25000 [Deltaproteobacteria bacterium]